jgi:hypothetical protein
MVKDAVNNIYWFGPELLAGIGTAYCQLYSFWSAPIHLEIYADFITLIIDACCTLMESFICPILARHDDACMIWA